MKLWVASPIPHAACSSVMSPGVPVRMDLGLFLQCPRASSDALEARALSCPKAWETEALTEHRARFTKAAHAHVVSIVGGFALYLLM